MAVIRYGKRAWLREPMDDLNRTNTQLFDFCRTDYPTPDTIERLLSTYSAPVSLNPFKIVNYNFLIGKTSEMLGIEPRAAGSEEWTSLVINT